MKYLSLILIFIFLLVFNSNGQVNLIDTLRLDTLGSNCTYGIETSNKFVFSADYGKNDQIYENKPFKGSSLISYDKISGQKRTLFHLNSADTSWTINYLFAHGDTVCIVEIALFNDTSCNCNALKIFLYKYDENLNLINNNTIDILKSNSFQFTPYFISANNDNHLCIATSKMEQSKSLSLFWIVDIKNNSQLFNRERFTSFQDSFRAERLHSVSVNDDGDFLFFGLGLNFDTWTSKDILIRLIASNNYFKKHYLIPHSFSSTNSTTLMNYSVKYVTEKHNRFYMTSWGHCIQDSTATTSFSFKSTVPLIKCFAIDSVLVSYKGTCAPIDSTPIFSGGVYDIQQPTAKQPIRFINDRTFVDIHPSHIDDDNPNGPKYTPCQAFPSRMEIVYWDTSLNVLQRTWISSPQENFYVNGYFETTQKNLMIYGHLCRYNHPLDSIQLFAFLLDQNSGHLLNIFNAEGFQLDNIISIHPNPFTQQFVVSKMQVQHAELLLYDGLGKLVLRQNIKESTTTIATNDLPNGLYFYTFINSKGERIQSGKLMKE